MAEAAEKKAEPVAKKDAPAFKAVKMTKDGVTIPVDEEVEYHERIWNGWEVTK